MSGNALNIKEGGTSQVTAPGARKALGLEIGVAIQAWDAGLDALAAFNTNGFVVQTANNVFAGRTISGTANEITLTNGSGVAGNPVVSIPSAVTFTSKTITGGAYIGGTWDNGAIGATTRSTIAGTTGNFNSTLAVTGVTTLSASLDISAAGAGQIVFPATQNASAGANTLDDYEEGTWTPAFGTSGVAFTTVGYSAQEGTYEKIGRFVRIAGHITANALTVGAASGNLIISGLPFNAGNAPPGSVTIGYIAGFTTNTPISGLTATGNINLYHRTAITGGVVPSTFAVLANGSDIYFSCVYYV